MYVRAVEIENVRSLSRLTWALDDRPSPGWHVILGDNGAGKSSFLRAVALALVGPEDIYGLRQSGEDWLRKDTGDGGIGVVFDGDPKFDRFAVPGRLPRTSEYGAFVVLKRDAGAVTLGFDESREVFGKTADRTIWNPGAKGWFAAGFGPFRRFTGGESDSERLAEKRPRLARYLSLFDERYALSDAVEWLVNLKFAALTGSGSALFDRVRRFINQEGFLPHGVRFHDVKPPKQVIFVDGANCEVPIEDLSDGFRSILSLTIELLRHLAIAYPGHMEASADGPIDVPGVVLIDEVDAHLHPTWQRKIGAFLLKAFPKLQFLVTTHSPLVCQNAEHGTIYLLPEHGSDTPARFATDAERARLVYGNVLDAYGTGAFGNDVVRSEAGKQKVERLAELNTKELDDELSEPEEAERLELRRELPSRASAVMATSSSNAEESAAGRH